MHRPERHARGVALLEGGDARRVIAAKAVAHHRDPLWVDVRPRGDIVVGRGTRHLIVVPAVDVAQALGLALAGAVDRERVDAALGEFDAGEDDAHLLAIVHAVEQDDGGRAAGHSWRLHEIGGERCALVRHVDELHVGMEPLDRGVIAAQRLAIHRHLLGTGRDEALGAVVVVAGAHVVIAGGDLPAFRRRRVGDLGDAIGHCRPFLLPRAIGIGLVLARLEPLPDPIDLVHGGCGPRRHALDDLHGVAPAQVAGEMHGPGSAFVCWHSVSSLAIDFAALNPSCVSFS